MNGLQAADHFAKNTSILPWMRRSCANGVTILMYHKVLPEKLIPSYPFRNLVVDASTFDCQMAWLADHFDVITVRDAMGYLDGSKSNGQKKRRNKACVTFDDGYLDNFVYAAPILEKHGLRATFFVTTGFVEGESMWFDRAALAWNHDAGACIARAARTAPDLRDALSGVASLEAWLDFLKKLSGTTRNLMLDATDESIVSTGRIFDAMNPDQIRALSDRGHEIGAHSVTHSMLTYLDGESLRYEMQRSKALVHEWTGAQSDGFCYPGGDCNSQVIAAARDAGYQYACTVRRGMASDVSDRLALPRRGILSSSRYGMTVDGFEAEVLGWHDLVRTMARKMIPTRKMFT